MNKSSRAGARDSVDPIITEILRNSLDAIAEEMKTVLMRTAYNPIIYEVQDFTVGLFNAKGDTVAIAIGLPMFVRGISETIKAMIAHFGADVHPGDILLTNDAYTTGSHLNHMTFAAPIFERGEIIAWAACMAHWPDVGGTLDGVTTDIWSEGLQMPLVKAWRKGLPNEDVLDIIRLNVRMPDRAMGDLHAQVGSIRAGERRFKAVIARYGASIVLASIDAIMDEAEAQARAQIKMIPDGVYEAQSFMDDDGVQIGKRIPIKVRVIVDGDKLTVDLTEVGKQVKGFYNSGHAAGVACCQVALKCLTSPKSRPINDGSFRPLEVILPPGRVVSAVRPASMRWWMTVPMTVVDTIFKALSTAIPDRIIAAHHADLTGVALSGHLPNGDLFVAIDGAVGGGWGAKKGEDGASTTIAINDGDTHNMPIEQWEAKYPAFVVENYHLRRDSGGAGTWRGGLGAEKTVALLDEVVMNMQIERVHCRPWGLFGGHPGAGNGGSIFSSGKEINLPSGKLLARRLSHGEKFTIRAGGGGGYGSPLDRPVERVVEDLREDYISRERAESCYGVVFAPDGAVDLALTEQQRLKLRAAEPLNFDDDEEVGADLIFDVPEVSLASAVPRRRCC